MRPLFIIPASGLVPAELASDFGATLSALVPIGGRPSLEHILERIGRHAEAVVTVAQGDPYVPRLISEWEGTSHTVPCSPHHSLADVLRHSLDRCLELDPAREIVIILSDTLADVDLPPDSIGVRSTHEAFRYTTVEVSSGGCSFEPTNSPKSNHTACVGVFRLQDPLLFRSLLRDDFFQALAQYSACRPLELHEVDEWHDLGHLNSYYRYRRQSYLSRHFNSLRLTPSNTVIKESADIEKMTAEFTWYRALPPALAIHAPRCLSLRVEGDRASYEMEHVPLPTVGEQLVWGRLSPDYWDDFFRSLDRLLRHFWAGGDRGTAKRVVEAASRHMYVDKTTSRVQHFLQTSNGRRYAGETTVDGEVWPSLADAVDQAVQRAEDLNLFDGNRWTTMHGDLFPGNLFFDPRADRVVAIDPRGSFGTAGIDGDPLYDLAKLSHSFLGRYDFLIARLFDVELTPSSSTVAIAQPDALPSIESLFAAHLAVWAESLGVEVKAVRAAEALLFFSALPLHEEDPMRQHAFIAQGLKALAAAS